MRLASAELTNEERTHIAEFNK
ncbi:hypothetical protein Zm00014a_042024 [Zea mays]|uniref:Uncharacterized protein n=1 Tax=Zea mays TaxID=4577 RepID=A0A3L6DM33_MAIZE|nr:hypothetical protein Zm00014a_042024 [Zea mays]